MVPHIKRQGAPDAKNFVAHCELLQERSLACAWETSRHLRISFVWQALGLDPAAAKMLSEAAASRIAGLLPSRAHSCML